MRIDDLHGDHARFQDPRAAALVALEGKLHVIRGERIAVVELDALAQHELVAEPVARRRPRLCEARRHRIPGHRLHEPVVQGVEHHERRDHARRFRRIEEGRRERDVHRPRHLARWRRNGADGRAAQQERDGEYAQWTE